ncbi:MAG: UDP-N-acetylglucosamine 2-epimerase (non-hydrolyzing) [Gammaproteobacteria bacterium]|nr:UDP-N-acetylglucosamine 2-epimerase (non-hydrolyzing) [Gammaproteobacteria bacterium]
MRILTVVGARPQFIKAAAVSRELRKKPEVEEILIHTGQHFDAGMSDIFFEQMEIPRPDHRLQISGMNHGAMTGRMLEGVEALITDRKPDWVLIYGDTNSTLAGALAAAKLHVPVAHVEAGLRSFNMRMPEEINRVLADRISSVLFCPTAHAVSNLEAEGYRNLNVEIQLVGDVMQDAALFYKSRARRPESVSTYARDDLILATVHRAENTDDRERLTQIVMALNRLHRDQPVVLPLHPRTRKCLEKYGLKLDLHVIEPVGYLEMVWLLEHAQIVLTDSGGLQKEAYFFGRPCVTLRDETEWVELVERGVNYLSGANAESILSAVGRMRPVTVMDDDQLYGGGQAARRIAQYFV